MSASRGHDMGHPQESDPEVGIHDHDRGLAFDLSTLVERRGAIKLLAGVRMLTLVGGATKSSSSAGSSSSTASSSTTSTTLGSRPRARRV